MRVGAGAVLVTVVIATACSSSSKTVTRSAEDEGRALFTDANANQAMSSGPSNRYACATCHRAAAGDEPDRVLPGAVLAGATGRPTFWGGQENDLLAAINDCRLSFMGAPSRWTADDEQAKAIFAWISTLTPADAAAQPFTVVATAADVPAGDAAAGSGLYARACAHCHGAPHTTEGALAPGVPHLPDDLLARAPPPAAARLAFIEKTRHGTFLGLGGTMPPFSREALSDADLGAVLAFLGL